MNKFMKLADELARINILMKHGGPFGAVVVKDGHIIAAGNNNVIKNNDPTAHAEIQAIRAACQKLGTFDLTGCELYTSCYPCPMCLSAIIWANIKTVYYGNTKEDAADIGFRDDMIYNYIYSLMDSESTSDVLKTIPLDREQTIKAFQEFKNQDDNIMY